MIRRLERWLRVPRLRCWLGNYELPEGGIIPRGHGIAYRRPWLALAVSYPMPLHLLVAWTRTAFLGLRFMYAKVSPAAYQAEWEEAYAAGLERGRGQARIAASVMERARLQGYQEGWRACATRIETILDRMAEERARAREAANA